MYLQIFLWSGACTFIRPASAECAFSVGQSDDQLLLQNPEWNRGEGSFSVMALKLWNELSPQIRQATSVNVFKSWIKTQFYVLAFNSYGHWNSMTYSFCGVFFYNFLSYVLAVQYFDQPCVVFFFFFFKCCINKV